MGGLFSFLNGSNEDKLFRACQNNDVAAATDAINKLAPGAGSEVALRLDTLYDGSGRNALMIAAIHGALDVIRFLVSKGMSLDARHTPSAASPLHLAAAAGQRDACLVLLDAGADATALNTHGYTAVDVARKMHQTHVLRALERRTALFSGWLKWERSSLFQAGLGKVLGASVKEALLKKFGGEWRECWVAVTKLTGKATNTMKCPRCSAQFSDPRGPGLRINCPRCSAELHIPQTPVISILELAIYGSPNECKPQICFPLNVVSTESEFNVPEPRLRAVKLYLQRPANAPVHISGNIGSCDASPAHAASGSYGIVEGVGKTALWAQSTLTMKAGEVRGTKKVVFAVDNHISAKQNLSRFIAAIRANPVNSVAYAAATRANPNPPLEEDDTLLAVAIEERGPEPTRPAPAAASASSSSSSSTSPTKRRSPPWVCKVCTLQNTAEMTTCAACDAPRTTSEGDVERVRSAQNLLASSATLASVVPPPPLPEERSGVMLLADDEDVESVPVAGEVPAHFICPLTGEIMDDPVIVTDGTSFERAALEIHFRAHGAVSPVTMMPLGSTGMVPNLALRSAIEQWRSSIPMASLAGFQNHQQNHQQLAFT